MKYKLWEHYLLHRLTQREIILYSHKTSYSANTVIGMTGSAIKHSPQADVVAYQVGLLDAMRIHKNSQRFATNLSNATPLVTKNKTYHLEVPTLCTPPIN